MPVISNTTATVALVAGQAITYSGVGTATFNGSAGSLAGVGTIGPFDRDVSVSLSGSLTYNVATPGNGVRVLAQAIGSFAAPVATAAGVASTITIPIFPGTIPRNSRVRTQATVKRTAGTGGTASVDVYLGVLGSASDPTCGSVTINATANHAVRTDIEAMFGESKTSFVSTGGVGIMNSGAGAGMQDRTGGVDRDALMYLTIVVTPNAADTMTMVAYTVTIEA